MRALNIILTLVIFSAACATAAWEVETIDSSTRGDRGICSLELDSRGRPHIAYFSRAEEPCVRYARWDGEAWVAEKVEASEEILGCDVSLALDGADAPHIVYNYYVRESNPRSRFGYKYVCKYARRSGEIWDVEEVATDVGYNGRLGAALDGEGRVHVAHRHYVDDPEGSRDELIYSRRDADDWSHELLAARKFLDGRVNIVLTGEGQPRVICGPRYFLPRGDRWVEKEIPGYGAAALDARDWLHLAFISIEHPFYADPEDGELHYARQTEGGWDEETVDVKWAAGGGTSLALDRDGLPHISYFNNYELCFAHFNGKEWVFHTVDGSDSRVRRSSNSSLALDGDGRPVIAYFDRLTGALKCARWEGGELRNLPPSETEGTKDLTAAGEIVSWYLEGVPYLTTDRRSPMRTLERCYIYAEPEEGAECLLEFDVPTEVEFVGGRSVRVSHGDMAGETWETYRAWVKVKVGDVVGWTDPSSFFSNDYPNPSFARFGKAYSQLKEGPSRGAPAVREDVKPGDRWRVGPTAFPGQYFAVVGRVGDWCCLERGISEIWAPAGAPGLEYFYLTYAWEPVGLAQFWFYLPGTAEVERVFYSVHTYMGAGGLPWKNPRLEVVAAGETYEATFVEKGYSGGYECGTSYFEFEFPRAVKREDIESMTFSVGDEGERIHFTIDPHDAWREPATEWNWPVQGFA